MGITFTEAENYLEISLVISQEDSLKIDISKKRKYKGKSVSCC